MTVETFPRTRLQEAMRAARLAWQRVDVEGAAHLATDGPVVFVGARAGDGPLLLALSRRPVIFARTGGAPGTDPPAEPGSVDLRKPEAARRLAAAIRAGSACVVLPPADAWSPATAWLVDRAGASVVPIHVEGGELSHPSGAGAWLSRPLAPPIRVIVGRPQRLDVDPALKGRVRRERAARALDDIVEEHRRQALDRHPSIPAAFATTGRASGRGRVALSDPTGARLSLHDLAVAADALARVLGRRFAAGDTVGLLLPTAAGVPVVLTALWRLRVVPAMLNPTLGPGPAFACLEVAGAARVLSSRAMVREARLEPLVAALEAKGIGFLWTEDLRAEVGLPEKLRAAVSARLGRARTGRVFPGAGTPARTDAAVILFTSGTEGSPKGVVLSHGNLLGNVAQLLARTDIRAADRFLSALPLFHSFGLTGGLLVPLIAGASVDCYPNPLHYKAIPELARTQRSTVIFGTDTFLTGWGRRAKPEDFTTMRAAIAGAEAVKAATRALWTDRFGVLVLEGYGATETSPVLALNTPVASKDGSVGRLLPGIEHRLEPMPGIDGQRLLVRGPNVMQGYLRAERPGELEPPPDGWYDTGDAVQIDDAGFVTIKGRIKRFAKVGGEMVSLAAVEALAARAWPDTPLAAVAIPDARKGNRVVLAIAPHDDATDTSATPLQAQARAEGVAEILLPGRILPLPAIPLLGSGKPDYPALTRLVLDAEPTASGAA